VTSWWPTPPKGVAEIELKSGRSDVWLDPAIDYLVYATEPVETPVVLNGGRFVWRAPMEVHLAKPGRAFYLLGQRGGIYCQGTAITGDQALEGFDIDQRFGATVIIENTLVEGLQSQGGKLNHADVIQTWAGPGKLIVVGMQATSDYQGFFLLPRQQWSAGPWPELFFFDRVQLHCPDYALWRDPGMPFPIVLGNDVWVQPAAKNLRWRDGFLWPKKTTYPSDTTWDKVKVGTASASFVTRDMVGCGITPSWV
jgi:hypothetical protein